jgi:pentatricopeptide repeat protein
MQCLCCNPLTPGDCVCSCCGKAGQWKEALRLFKCAESEGVQADSVIYNALISAMARGGQATKAYEIFMEGHMLGLKLFTNEAAISSVLCAFSHTRVSQRFQPKEM